MAPECTFILSTGKKCRCAATRHQTLCRHHAPRRAVAGPPAIPKRERYSNLIRWRELGANIPWMPIEHIPNTIHDLLQCLIDRGPDSTGSISDLTAGRFLRALLNRLGYVPFPVPDPAAFQPAAAAPPAYPTSPLNPRELQAMLAQFGLPPSQAPMHQSRARVNQ